VNSQNPPSQVLEQLRKKPINIGGEHSIGFIIPSKWAKELGLDPERDATLTYEQGRIVIQP
jgi:hypothetical protein